MANQRGYLNRGKEGICCRPAKAAATPALFKDRNIAAMAPENNQFEPTEAVPVPQRYKMAGGA